MKIQQGIKLNVTLNCNYFQIVFCNVEDCEHNILQLFGKFNHWPLFFVTFQQWTLQNWMQWTILWHWQCCFILSSCEEAFMKTTFPPNSSQIVDLIFPDFSQPLQVKKILVDIKDIIEQSIQAMITLAIIDSVYALSLPKICNSDWWMQAIYNYAVLKNSSDRHV